MNDKISKKDKKDWENFISSDEKLLNKDQTLNNKKILQIKHIDLHGFTLEQANITIEKIIKESYENHISKIIVVTGKGLHSNTDNDIYVSRDLSKLKFSVPEFINNNHELNNCVFSISEASIKDGGAGAILIKLKNL